MYVACLQGAREALRLLGMMYAEQAMLVQQVEQQLLLWCSA
jgi:hypothetical protein